MSQKKTKSSSRRFIIIYQDGPLTIPDLIGPFPSAIEARIWATGEGMTDANMVIKCLLNPNNL